MEEINAIFSTVRCTYVEMYGKDGKFAYSISAKDCAKFGAPFVVENFSPLTADGDALIRAYLKYQHGHMNLESWRGNLRTYFHVGAAVERPEDVPGVSDSLQKLISNAWVKVMLTGDGYDMICANSGQRVADQISTADTYVLSPFIREVVSEVEPEPEPEPEPKKDDKLSKLLLLLAGWVLLN